MTLRSWVRYVVDNVILGYDEPQPVVSSLDFVLHAGRRLVLQHLQTPFAPRPLRGHHAQLIGTAMTLPSLLLVVVRVLAQDLGPSGTCEDFTIRN